MRLPPREQFRLIINELGAGLAGNGEPLSAAVKRADPALQQLTSSSRCWPSRTACWPAWSTSPTRCSSPGPSGASSSRASSTHAGETALAAAERGDDIERNFQHLPVFLRELKPAADRFGALADQMAPALESLQAQAPAINAAITRFGPFTEAALPAVETLGRLRAAGAPLFPAIQPLVRRPARPRPPAAARGGRPCRAPASFDETGGIEELMRSIYFYTDARSTGLTSYGHYVRSILGLSTCSERASEAPCEPRSTRRTTRPSLRTALPTTCSAGRGGDPVTPRRAGTARSPPARCWSAR